jgi:hypothetical protein
MIFFLFNDYLFNNELHLHFILLLIYRLERESGLYFDMEHFEDMILNGKWDEVEKYLSGFTKVEDNAHSTKIFFELRKQKYLEALDR